jgi:hypothetical protein
MERQTLIDLIRQNYDPEPRDWPRHRGWDDGVEDIAEAILACMVAKPASECSRCPKCGLEAATMLHRLCTKQACPVKASLHERKYGAVTVPQC